jgi:hypothetical protein
MVCQTKGQWSHAENNVMQKLDVLTRINQYEEPLFLNKQIGATRWIPKGYNGEHANNIVESFNNNLVQLILNPEFYE